MNYFLVKDRLYLARAAGDAYYVFRIKARKGFRLLLIREECVKVL